MHPRVLRTVGPAILVTVALIVLLGALAYGGGAAALPIGDAGPVARWGLPIAKLMLNLASAGMVGVLIAALLALRSGERAFDVALDVASISAAVFTVAAGTTGFLTFVDAFDPAIDGGPLFGAQLGRFLVDLEAGRTWLITTVAGAALTVLTFAVRSWTATLVVALLAVAALVPMGTQGHSGEDAFHHEAMMALILHVIGAAVWLGGLILIVIVRPILGPRRVTDVVGSYSSIALAAFVLVAVSGTVRASLGLQTWAALVSPYGAILVTKIVALVALGSLGVWYRARLLVRMRTSDAASRSFWALVALEFVLMGAASGAAAALARTPPPIEALIPEPPSPAERLTGAPLPVEPTAAQWFLSWNVDLLWAVVAGFAVFFYLAGVFRLRRAGQAWPVHRTLLWVTGAVLLVWVTGGVLNIYQDYLFSMHMLQGALLTTAIPVLLVAGAPVPLAMRAIRPREDGTRGGHEWILWAVHTPLARILTNPLEAAVLFVASPWIFTYTGLFRWSLSDHLGHQVMVAYFLTTGYLLAQAVIGIDPVRRQLPHVGMLIVLGGVMLSHVIFGVSVMMRADLLVADWFGSMGRVWGATPLADQYIGGSIAWSIGVIATLILTIIAAVQWVRSGGKISI